MWDPRLNLCRCLLLLVPIVAFSGAESWAQSPVSREWKQRLTDSLRRHIVQEGERIPVGAIGSATPDASASTSAAPEEPISLLSSLTGLLTQAATETITFSREMRPTLEWPGELWNTREKDGWSWRRRLQWFQGREGEAAGTPASATATVPAATQSEASR